jgi:hypothetical protein
LSNYQITIIANVNSSLSKEDLQSKLVASLFDIESEERISDGDNSQLEVVEYELTEAIEI